MKSLKTNAFLNVIQNICKILFPLITIPYASRVLEAENYGKVSFGNSIVRYFILFAALGIGTYSQREAASFRNDKRRIKEFSNQIFTINIISTIIAYVTLILLLLYSTKLKDYSLLILVQSSVILLGTLGADWINVIYEDYFYITVRYILMQLVSVVMLFVFVKTPSDYIMYAIVNVVATAGGNVFNIFYIRRYVKLRLVNPRECIRHLKPVLLLFCVSIATVIYVSSDITILGYYMTDTDVGIYTMSANIYSVVKQIISALLVVSIPRLAYHFGNDQIEEYKKLAQKVLDSLLAILLPAIVGLIFLSHEVLNLMGGEQYVSGESALIFLAVALLFAILAGFYANGCLLIAKKDKRYLIATVFSAVINIGMNFVLIPIIGIIGAAITTLLAEISMSVITGSFAIKTFHLVTNKKTIISAIINAFAVGVICYVIKLLELGTLWTIALSFICSAIVFYFLIRATGNPLSQSVNEIVRKVVVRKKQ